MCLQMYCSYSIIVSHRWHELYTTRFLAESLCVVSNISYVDNVVWFGEQDFHLVCRAICLLTPAIHTSNIFLSNYLTVSLVLSWEWVSCVVVSESFDTSHWDMGTHSFYQGANVSNVVIICSARAMNLLKTSIVLRLLSTIWPMSCAGHEAS